MIQLGIVTYNIAKGWDLPTILMNLEELKYGGVELRTGHAHGVEPGLSAEARREVRRRFEDSPVDLAGIGTTHEFQAVDPAVVRSNVEGAKASIRLAHDVGSPGIKVRPNGIAPGADRAETFKRIGDALREVGEYGVGFGIEVRVEVHGEVTQEIPNFAEILAVADHPNVFTCWNSNPGDVVGDAIRPNFERIEGSIREVHLRDLTDESYPWKELFALLFARGYDGYTLAEIPESADPMRVLRYFRSLWLALQPA